MDYEKMKRDTDEAMGSPKRGDVFSERASNWYTVLEATDEHVIVAERVEKLEIKRYTRLGFTMHFGYESIPGYWIALHKRRADVSRFDDLLAVFKKYELESCHA
jgi:hypothetical protein